MNAKGFTTIMAGSLSVSISGVDWFFSVRRTDGETHGPFCAFHGKEVSVLDIKEFLPDLADLEWIKIEDSPLSHSESYTKNSEFKVNVMATEGSNKNHQEVIDAFMSFMA